MHEHSYIGCEHALKHCKHCDVVYCEKCKREWRQTASINSDLMDQIRKWGSKPTDPPIFERWPDRRWPSRPTPGDPFLPKPGIILCQHSGA